MSGPLSTSPARDGAGEPGGGAGPAVASLPGGPGAVVAVEGVSKRYGAVVALDDVELSIAPGEIHALVGHNGAGKSTLVKVLSGLVTPDRGALRIDGAPVVLHVATDAQRHGIALVDQELSLVPGLSVADNVLLGAHDAPLLVRRRAERARVRELLALVGLEEVAPATPVGALAIGERQLVEIARGVGRSARLLILDEPTATLSQGEIGRVFATVRAVAERGAGVLFVSHRLGEVLDLCQRATVLRDGRVVACEETARLDRDRLIELMLGHRPAPRVRVARMAPGAGPPALRVRGLSAPRRLHGVDLEVRRGEIVALAGQVGSGAGDALRALAGLDPDAAGTVEVGGRALALRSVHRALAAGVLYLTDDRKGEGLFFEQDVRENLLGARLAALTRVGIVRRRRSDAVASSLARTVGVEERLRSAVGALSGGNQQKVLLGRGLDRAGVSVLLLHEPTRGVDIAGRERIHELVTDAAAAGCAIVFVSTELDELLDLADTIVTMAAGRVVAVRPRAHADAATVLADMTHAGASDPTAGTRRDATATPAGPGGEPGPAPGGAR